MVVIAILGISILAALAASVALIRLFAEGVKDSIASMLAEMRGMIGAQGRRLDAIAEARTRPPAPELTLEERAAIESIAVCAHCGGRHAFTCPYILETEWGPEGAVTRMRFTPERFEDLRNEILYLDD